MFNIVTPVSRPDNLPLIYDGIKNYGNLITWWVVYDSDALSYSEIQKGARLFESEYWISQSSENGGVTGSRQRNKALDCVEDGWVYFLDDDNLLHQDLIHTILLNRINNPDIQGYIFNQLMEKGIRIGSPENTKVTHIDTAQFCLRRDLIGDLRFKDDYCADGYFIEELYNKNKDKFIFLNKELSYYNRLRWSDYEVH